MRFVLALAALAMALAAHAAGGKSREPNHGALAFHAPSGSYGYAVDQPNERGAGVAALQRCGHPQCEVVLKFRNECGAVAAGAKTHAVGKGATRAEAETRALRKCGADCTPAAWACTR